MSCLEDFDLENLGYVIVALWFVFGRIIRALAKRAQKEEPATKSPSQEEYYVFDEPEEDEFEEEEEEQPAPQEAHLIWREEATFQDPPLEAPASTWQPEERFEETVFDEEVEDLEAAKAVIQAAAMAAWRAKTPTVSMKAALTRSSAARRQNAWATPAQPKWRPTTTLVDVSPAGLRDAVLLHEILSPRNSTRRG